MIVIIYIDVLDVKICIKCSLHNNNINIFHYFLKDTYTYRYIINRHSTSMVQSLHNLFEIIICIVLHSAITRNCSYSETIDHTSHLLCQHNGYNECNVKTDFEMLIMTKIAKIMCTILLYIIL